MIRKRTEWSPILVAAVLLLVSTQVLADCEVAAGRVVSIQGVVEVRGAESERWAPVSANARLCAGDRIAVRALGRAAIVLADDVLVRLDQNSTLTVMPSAHRADRELGLAEGAVHVISRFRKRFGVQTPFVNAMVDGTEFTVMQDQQRGRVVVSEGRVRARNNAGELVLLAGQSAEAGPSGAPSPIQIRPMDAIRWAIHYPPVVRLSASAQEGLPGTFVARVRQAEALWSSHEPSRALEVLGDDDALKAVPALRALRASMLLSVGRVDEARKLIGEIPAGEGGASLLALDAIAKLAANDLKGAMSQAEAAVAADRGSSAAWLALSYAKQGSRDPEGALAAAATACQVAPDDALAWARRAELALALSRIEEGRRHAVHALEIDPAVARGNALLGFAELLGGDLAGASRRFGDALEIDANEPLAHLGAGLTLIRSGQLASGRRELEIAVILDPSNAELRSTLGRAYLEEARGKVASDQFELAKRLDPASPTPWYYGAFGKLRANDPLGAISDGQRAIELNDNRAVLRSDSLLDSDRAARNADLGLAYKTIGFEASLDDAARRAIEDDPGSSAAHRLMGETYAGGLTGFEEARVSELLQARLRAPLGSRPAEAYQLVPALPILDGPRALSPDETTALFSTGPTQIQAGMLLGSQNTRGLSVTGALSSDRAQTSVSAFDLKSDGFGDAADIAISGQRLALQLAPSAATSVFGELNHSDRSGSNTAQRLFPDAGDPDREIVTRRDSGRLSLRHAPSANQEWILSVAAGQIDKREKLKIVNNFPPFGPITLTHDDIRHVDFHDLGFHHSRVIGESSVQIGASAYRSDERSTAADSVDPPIFPVGDPTNSRHSVAHDSAYGYYNHRFSEALSLVFGADYQHFVDSRVTQVERINGKLGVTYQPAVGTEIRAAVFQTVKGDYWREENLEPTRFNGFEQSFDDLNGTTSTRFAVAGQRRLSGGALLGGEWSTRRLSIPNLGCDALCRAPWRELRHSVFAEVPLGVRAALSARWQYESLELEGPIRMAAVPVSLRTETLPLSLWLHVSPELSSVMEVVRMRQKGAMFGAGGLVERQESVWLANLNFRYQRPLGRWYVEAGVRNLFDQVFAFQNTDMRDEARTPRFYPERSVYLRVGVSF